MKKAKKTPSPKPWERQKNESDVAFAAFVAYRDMGADRSQDMVGRKLAKSRQQIAKWSSQWNWVERASAWDDELDRMTRTEIAKGVTAMRKKYINTAEAVLMRGLKGLDNIEPEDMTPRDVKEFLRLAMEMETKNRLPGFDEAAVKPDDGFIEALNDTAANDWNDYDGI